jgi:hypothetical protein
MIDGKSNTLEELNRGLTDGTLRILKIEHRGTYTNIITVADGVEDLKKYREKRA